MAQEALSAAIPGELTPYSPPPTNTAVVKTCAAPSSTATPPSVGLGSSEGLNANDLQRLPPRRHRQDRSTSSSTPCSRSAERKGIGIARPTWEPIGLQTNPKTYCLLQQDPEISDPHFGSIQFGFGSWLDDHDKAPVDPIACRLHSGIFDIRHYPP